MYKKKKKKPPDSIHRHNLLNQNPLPKIEVKLMLTATSVTNFPKTDLKSDLDDPKIPLRHDAKRPGFKLKSEKILS